MTPSRFCVLLGIASPAFTATANAQWTWEAIRPVNVDGYFCARAGLVEGGSGQVQFVGNASLPGFNEFRAVMGRSGDPLVTDLNPVNATSSTAFATDGHQQVGFAAMMGDSYHASLWRGTAESWIDLHPPGAISSQAFGVARGQQVGIYAPGPGWYLACLWMGSAETLVDLNPAGAIHSSAQATDGVRQVGSAIIQEEYRAGMWTGTAESWHDLSGGSPSWAGAMCGDAQGGRFFGIGEEVTARWRACMWKGTAESRVDLHPAGAAESEVRAMCPGVQVGVAYIGQLPHACVWFGTRDSWVDLHLLLPSDRDRSTAQGVWRDSEFVYIVGCDWNPETYHTDGVLWKIPVGDLPCSADLGRAGGVDGADGTLDNNDFIAFIGAFFDAAPVADRGMTGGVEGPDGAFDNNDFIVFIHQFFAGCA